MPKNVPFWFLPFRFTNGSREWVGVGGGRWRPTPHSSERKGSLVSFSPLVLQHLTESVGPTDAVVQMSLKFFFRMGDRGKQAWRSDFKPQNTVIAQFRVSQYSRVRLKLTNRGAL